jgi:hypothetical protein
VQHLKHSIGRFILVSSLLINTLLLGLGLVIWQTNWLDAPILMFALNKNCGSESAASEPRLQELFDLACQLSSQATSRR